MKRPVQPHWLVLTIAGVSLFTILLALLLRNRDQPEEAAVTVTIKGPEIILDHREPFRAGIEALSRHDAPEAIATLSSFSFEGRPIEHHRFYLLANAYSLAGDSMRSVELLERVWRKSPEMVISTDIAFHLLQLYSSGNEWSRSALVSRQLAEVSSTEIIASTARRQQLVSSFHAGDPGGAFRAALHLATEEPDSDAGSGSVELVTAWRDRPPGAGLEASERLVRARRLLEEHRAAEALDLARRIDADRLTSDQRDLLRLVTGQALGRTGRHEEAERELGPLFSGRYEVAIPALESSARSYRLRTEAAEAASRRGSRKERDLRAAEAKQLRTLYLERLNDLLSLPIGRDLRVLVLERLIDDAQEREQVERMKRLITALTRVDPANDRGLQVMWDQGWLAFEQGNDPVAIDRFDFISVTYRDPGIRRQARYWLARALERAGKKDRAKEILLEIAAAEYLDLYGLFARERIGSDHGRPPLPLSTAEDWLSLAEREMPAELRLAWELTILGEYSEAREEIRRHRVERNERFADALLAESFHAEGAWQIANRYLERAFPSIGTAEQSDVPLHFLRMYYVLPFEDAILEHATDRSLDPSFIAALAHQETTFNPRAVSPVGAKGIMQLMPGTAREIGKKLYTVYQEDRLFDPDFNIDLGTYYVDHVLKMMDGDLELTAAGYNGGPYRIRKWRRESRKPKDEFIEGMPLHETRNYVKRVTILRSSYRALYPSLRATPQTVESGS